MRTRKPEDIRMRYAHLTEAEIFGRSMHPEFRRMLRPILERPLSPQRWRAFEREILGEIERRADALGVTPDEALYLTAVAALRLANEEGRRERPRQTREWLIWYRRRVQQHVIDDLLGAARERAHETLTAAENIPEPDPVADAERRAEAVRVLDELQEVATEAEAEVLDLIAELIEAGLPPHRARLEAGRITGRTPAAMRQLLRRLRRRHASRIRRE